MDNRIRVLLALGIGLIALPAGTAAHFRLLEPQSWLEMNNLGDPQKVGPCGGDPKGENQKLLTNAVTKVAGGSKLHLKIQETIFHSGHYRVALAVNSRTELPPDPSPRRSGPKRGSIQCGARSRAHRGFPHPCRRLVPALSETRRAGVRDAEDADGSVGNGHRAAEHQLPEVHAASDPVHGRSRLQPAWRLRVPPLRGSSDHRGSLEADRQTMAFGFFG